jgi:hypothetical protein
MCSPRSDTSARRLTLMNELGAGSSICLHCVDYHFIPLSSKRLPIPALMRLPTICQQVVKGQFDRDTSLMELMESMQELYLFVDAVKAVPQKIDRLESIILMILRQTVECVVFIREYSGHGFGGTHFSMLTLLILSYS